VYRTLRLCPELFCVRQAGRERTASRSRARARHRTESRRSFPEHIGDMVETNVYGSVLEAVLQRVGGAWCVLGGDGVVWATAEFDSVRGSLTQEQRDELGKVFRCIWAGTSELDNPGLDMSAPGETGEGKEWVAVGAIGLYAAVLGETPWAGGSGVLVELSWNPHAAGAPYQALSGEGRVDERVRSMAVAVTRRSAGFLEEVFETVGEGLVVYDRTGKVVLANRSAKEFLAGSGSRWDAYDGNGQRLSRQDTFRRVFKPSAHDPKIVELRRSDGGETRWVSARTRRTMLPDGGVGAVTSFADVTENMLALAAVEESRETYRAVFAEAGAGIVTVTVRGDKSVVEMNDAALEMLAIPRSPRDLDEAIRFRPVIYDIDGGEVPMERGPLLRVLQGERLRRVVYQLRSSGEVRWVEVSGSGVVLGDRHSVSVLWLNDITAERAREAVLVAAGTQLASANDELRQLFRRVAEVGSRERADVARELHDGPVQTLVALRWAIGRYDQSCAETCEMVIDQLRSMILDLRPPVLDEEGLAAACADLLGRSSISGRLESSALDEGVLTEACRDLGWRVVREGVQNVARHARGADEVVVTLRSVGERLVIEVQDNGGGVDAELAGAASREGHYGLYLLRQGVESAGGTLELVNGEHGGAVLRAEFPCR
jgi:signal transduction histidine kinase